MAGHPACRHRSATAVVCPGGALARKSHDRHDPAMPAPVAVDGRESSRHTPCACYNNGVNDLSLLDDYRWLTGAEGARWLRRAAEDRRPLVNQADRLRRRLSPQRTHLVLQQVELRRRARAKFADAGRMFFTPLGLQQATDQFVAAYKAARFPQGPPLADLCCGIGGDLLGLARRGPVLGIDRDPAAALLAEANARALGLSAGEGGGAEVRSGDVADVAISEFAAWHLDPDRRPKGRRTTMVELCEPGLPVIEKLLVGNADAAVKLAPAAALPDAWPQEAELEWIGRDRQCRQLVAWFGRLAEHPGKCRATILDEKPDGGADVVRTVIGKRGRSSFSEPGSCDSAIGEEDRKRAASPFSVGRYVFDPDPAVLAAGLSGALAAEHGLSATGPRAAYLTGDRPVADPALACFEVTDVLPLDLKRLRRLLHERGIGRLEIKTRIKTRGVAHEPGQLRRQLHLRGDGSAVLLLAPIGGTVTAILARRLA